MGKLKSRLFTVPFDQRLEDCATNHSAHLMGPKEAAKAGRRPDRGPFMTRIHTALETLMPGAKVAGSEKRNQEFGGSTEELVLFYKTDRKVVNLSYQTSPDAIIGIMTMERMDGELRGKDLGNDFPIVPIDPFGNNFEFVVPRLPLTIKFSPDDPSKQDLENQPVNRTFAEQKARRLAVMGVGFATEGLCKNNLRTVAGAGGPLALDMAEFLFKNNNSPRSFVRVLDNSSGLSRLARNDRAFVANHRAVVDAMRRSLREIAQPGNPRKVDVGRLQQNGNNPPAWRNFVTQLTFDFKKDPTRVAGDPLAFAIGGIQGLEITLTSFEGHSSGHFEGTLNIAFWITMVPTTVM